MMGRGILFFIVIILFGVLLIISNNNLAMYKPENVQKFFPLFSDWLKVIYNNFLTMTGQVVKMNWTIAK